MLLRCSSCGTRFLVDAAALGPQGRMVQCGKCAHCWFQYPPDEPKSPVEVVEPPSPEDVTSPARYLPAIRQPDPGRRVGGGWSAALCLVLLIFGGAFFGRQQIMQAWPGSVHVYEGLAAATGVRLLSAGQILSIDEISGRRATRGELPVLVIEGLISNPSQGEVDLPRLRVALLDAGSDEVRDATFQPVKRRLLGGEVLPFRTYIADPPPAAIDVSVDFAPD